MFEQGARLTSRRCPRSIRRIPDTLRQSVIWMILESGGIMLRHLINAVAIIIILSGAARAQVVPGDSPSTWNAAWAYGVSRTHDLETAWRRQEEEREYHAVVKRIPNKKPPNDPWKNVRQAPPEADRHRVQ